MCAPLLEECGEEGRDWGTTRHARHRRHDNKQNSKSRIPTRAVVGCRSVAQLRRPQKRLCYPQAHPRSWDVETHGPAGIVRARIRANEVLTYRHKSATPRCGRARLRPMPSQSPREITSKVAHVEWVVSSILRTFNTPLTAQPYRVAVQGRTSLEASHDVLEAQRSNPRHAVEPSHRISATPIQTPQHAGNACP
ncbi:uncharacterized protein CC84DRAFT_483201 [Paraphaeosphaeria sporulosa]|uniref:Uncharacterized protein n=1 Tax=Paraphaeosphaeria sporulosa TaxID=1460663 RepID=A0A177CSW0_9PLEO|nr:uncharacterized protein CC84DRAFT_483201 [Paraphaeosphaeria sporulosa]OAG10386.1 hypothetical protein CC84DRAFT_483201 [Paraphaeosphaeria sporulosa]